MSPRKTRRGAKTDGANETLVETISKKSEENSPPPSQRTMKTRRQLSKTLSHDSEADQSLEVNKSQMKPGQETPSGKSTRSRRKAPIENVIDDSSSVLDVTTSTTKRTTRAKNNDVTFERTVLLDNSAANESQAEKSRATRTRKRVPKKEDSKSEDETTGVTKGKRKNKNTSIIGNGHGDSFVNGAENPMSKEDVEVQQASDRISRLKASASTPSSPRSGVKRRGRNARAKIEDFTPESSPIVVNLSPHRTTKTPRKSPMNLGSPKSHAEQSLRLTKTPRKLRVVVESPAASDKSVESSLIGTPKKSPNHLSTSETRIHDSSSKKKKKRTPKKKSPVNTPQKSPSKDLVRKFTKSPKIVLKTPKAKSSKSKSPRVVASKAKKSPVPKSVIESPIKPRKTQSSTEPNETPDAEDKISPSRKRVSISQSPKKSMISQSTAKSPNLSANSRSPKIHSPNVTASPRISRNASLVKESKINESQKSPTVILNKISTPDSIKTDTTKRTSSRRSNASMDDSSKTTPITTPNGDERGQSPRRIKSAVKKRTPITNSDTKLKPAASPRTSLTKSNKNTPVDTRTVKGKINGKAPIISSTPRERIRRSLNLSPGLGATPTIINSPNIEPPGESSALLFETRVTRNSQIEDVTNPLISEDDESISLRDASRNSEGTRLDETFEIAKKSMIDVEEEETKVGDGTYELIEPKTPILRRKAGKRSIAEVDTSIEDRMTKRTCRVRFTSPSPNTEDKKPIPRNTGRSRSATPGQRITVKRIPPESSNVSIGKTARKRSNSMTNTSVIKTPASSIKRRSNSASDANVISASKTAQNASVNRLSKPRFPVHQSTKKTDVKTPVARKAPNFAEIHQRKFAKMESLIDAKKRVERRHLTLKTQVPTSLSKVNTAARSKVKPLEKTPAPNVPVNGVYNRYGFKLKKGDAIKIMSQKQSTNVSEKKQNENRLLLKGVRTNRRFDLIMKARNVNQ